MVEGARGPGSQKDLQGSTPSIRKVTSCRQNKLATRIIITTPVFFETKSVDKDGVP